MGARVLNLRNWSDSAACKGVADQFDFTPTTETTAGLFEAQKWCNLCPVREECLMTAMRNGWSGYWGGSMTAERKKLKAAKRRVKCPLCTSVNLVRVDGNQVCVACGRSWRTGQEPVVKEDRRRPSERSDAPQHEEVSVMGDRL